MDIMFLIFLSSGLFLGWSLGANDAANVFGTAVGTRMIKFKTAAIICSIFLILGAVYDGAGATDTLGQLGSVNAIAGSFMVALSAAFTVYFMTKSGLPVSTSQAIVGAIIGWNIYSGNPTDVKIFSKIAMTWVLCPILSAFFAIPLYLFIKFMMRKCKIHLLWIDTYTRIGLILAGAFGAYALGANNIANVMGVFVNTSPFKTTTFFNSITLTNIQQLFFIGAIFIALGVFTYSQKVMLTVGHNLMKMSPIIAWIAVISHSITLFLFSSKSVENFLLEHNLPSIPLVPVSSSQAIVGAVIGIGIIKGARGIKWNMLGKIATGWVTTPILSSIICFISLFFLQNVFGQTVFR